MLHFITEIKKVHENFVVDCHFNTGETKRIELAEMLDQHKASPLVAEVYSPEGFRQVSLDSYGTLCWPNGLDFCPDVLYEMSKPISSQGV